MHVVIFEVWPKEEKYDEYLNIAAQLLPELQKIDGFISIERFSSIVNEGKILSISFWRDEEAIAAWRTQMDHGKAQLHGRNGIFTDYRLRVASVERDYGMFERAEAPQELPEVKAQRPQE